MIELNSTASKLLKERWFLPVGNAIKEIPKKPGIYAIRLAKPESLKPSFREVLEQRNSNLIYIGIASKNLNRRLKQELWAKGHGTFFRSLGAVLGYMPPEGSLIGKKNQNNYKFTSTDEVKISQWIENNLLINWVEVVDSLNKIEHDLINQYLPLLNIAGNPRALKELTVLRNKCKVIARG